MIKQLMTGFALFVSLVLPVSCERQGRDYQLNLPIEDWRVFRDAFVTTDGRVMDTANNNISHSEGQGYALIFAVAANAPDDFEIMWNWTRHHLQIRKRDNLFAWKWNPETTMAADRNSATDGDILIAWALIEASQRWGNADYENYGSAILRSVKESLIVETKFGKILLPGSAGFRREDDAVIANLSYWIYPALASFKAFDDDAVWEKLQHSGMRIAERAQFGKHRLPSDWVEIAENNIAPSDEWPPLFSYDAIRIPIYACLSLRTYGSDSISITTYRSFFTIDSPHYSVWNVKTDEEVGVFPGWVGRALATQLDANCAASPDPYQYLSRQGNYFDAVLLLLMRMTGSHRQRFSSQI